MSKNPAAVAMGKLGGRARAARLTAARRVEIARKGGLARAARVGQTRDKKANLPVGATQ